MEKVFPDPLTVTSRNMGGAILLVEAKTGKEFIRRMSTADTARAVAHLN